MLLRADQADSGMYIESIYTRLILYIVTYISGRIIHSKPILQFQIPNRFLYSDRVYRFSVSGY